MLFTNLNNFLYSTLPCLGVLVVGYYLLSFFNLLFRNLLLPCVFSKRSDIRKFGTWVIITGASDGIGKAFAETLAKEKYNLVLISRSKDKLENIKLDLQSKYKIDILLISSDFTQVDIYDTIKEKLKNLDVGLLINNVGMSSSFPDDLTNDERNSNREIVNLIHCNCVSTVLMTKLMLQLRMAEKGGFILNISSVSSILPVPLLSIYGASKAFINAFSVNMASELKCSNVTFQTVAPFYVSTKMSRMKPNLFVVTPRSYANSVLNRLGTCSFTYGCFIHELQAWFVRLVPDFLIGMLIYRINANVRKAALRKAAKSN